MQPSSNAQPPVPVLYYLEEQLNSMGAQKVGRNFTSPSGVTYQLFGMIAKDATGNQYYFIPIYESIEEIPAQPGKQKYIQINRINPNVPSPWENYRAANLEKKLQWFPNEIIPNDARLQGLTPIAQSGFGFIAQSWCIETLTYLEIAAAERVPNRKYTLILEDEYKTNNQIYKRPKQFETAIYPKEQILGAFGTNIPIKTVDFTPNENVTAVMYGRPQCLDLISMIVVNQTIQAALPNPNINISNLPAGFQAPAIYTDKSNFANPPMGNIAQSTATNTGIVEPLPPNIVTAVEEYLKRTDPTKPTKSNKNASKMSRINKLVENTLALNTKPGKVLDIDTRNLKKPPASGFSSEDYTENGINFRLVIKNDILGSLISSDKGIVDPRTNTNTRYVRSFFRYVIKRILELINVETSKSESILTPVPINILSNIPAGPMPAKRQAAQAQTSFTTSIPLANVTEISLPLADAQKCTPSLMAKKRD